MTTTIHVLPLRDLVEHVVPGGLDGHGDEPGRWLWIEADETAHDDGCVCGPTAELVANAHAPDGWVVTHHSLDGRELLERTDA